MNKLIVLIGIPAIVGTLVYIGKKLQLLNSLEKTAEIMKHNIKAISDFLVGKSNLNFDSSELMNYSPLSLTDKGKALINDLGFDNVFEKNRKDFFNFIENEDPKLKYDAELAAIKSIRFLSDKPYMEFLKVFFYNNPNRSMENTAPTLGIYVRDKYLEEHPEITE